MPCFVSDDENNQPGNGPRKASAGDVQAPALKAEGAAGSDALGGLAVWQQQQQQQVGRGVVQGLQQEVGVVVVVVGGTERRLVSATPILVPSRS